MPLEWSVPEVASDCEKFVDLLKDVTMSPERIRSEFHRQIDAVQSRLESLSSKKCITIDFPCRVVTSDDLRAADEELLPDSFVQFSLHAAVDRGA